jgi:hypothetical protein
MKGTTMMHALGAALRALLTVALLGAVAAPAKACATAESVTAEVRHEIPGADVRLIEPPLAERLRAGISALIGKQVPAGGRYLLVDAPGTPTTYVVRFQDGCATHHGRFPDRLVRTWLEERAA